MLRAEDVDLPDWRWLLNALHGRFSTGDFATGAAFVAAIAEIADELNHHPDIDLRYGHVTIVMSSHDVGGVTRRDVELATRISALADASSLSAEPEQTRALELALDTPSADAIRPFWAAVLGYEDDGDVLADPAGGLPQLWFQDTTSSDPARQRFHLDVSVALDEAQRRIVAALKAGGRLVDTSHQPAFTVLEDVDGNKACICTSFGREG